MQLFFEKENLRDQIDALLFSVYAPDNADDESLDWYYQSNWVRIAIVLGLPTQYLGDKNNPPITISSSFFIKNIAQNFFGWRSRANPIFLLFRMLLTTSYQLLASPLRMFLNVLKVASELIPGLILIAAWRSFKWTFQKLSNLIQDQPNLSQSMVGQLMNSGLIRLIKSLLALPFAFGFIGILLGSWALFFIGHCFTSPIQSLNEAWQLGKKASIFRGILYVAAVMTLISLLYMVAFPLGIKLLTLTLLPLIPKILPPALFHVFQLGTQLLSPILTSFGNMVLQIANTSILPIVQGLLGSGVAQFLAVIITAMPAAVGGGVIFGALMGVGPGIYRIGQIVLQSLGQGLANFFQGTYRFFHRPTNAPNVLVVNNPHALLPAVAAVSDDPGPPAVAAVSDEPQPTVDSSSAAVMGVLSFSPQNTIDQPPVVPELEQEIDANPESVDSQDYFDASEQVTSSSRAPSRARSSSGSSFFSAEDEVDSDEYTLAQEDLNDSQLSF